MELLVRQTGPCRHAANQPADGKVHAGSGGVTQVGLRGPLLTLVSDSQISLGLLLFGDWPLCAVSSRCMDDKELSQRLEKLQRRLENSSYLDAHNSSADLKDRSISPWTYK